MQGGDKICASAPVYSNTLKRLCHACDVAGADAGKPHWSVIALCHTTLKKWLLEKTTVNYCLSTNTVFEMLGLMLIMVVVHMEFLVLHVL